MGETIVPSYPEGGYQDSQDEVSCLRVMLTAVWCFLPSGTQLALLLKH